ncbi:MAG TPA: hypothetical protein VMX94_03735 [Armatimonadota bacterium]|nr:hypothetical protein [Armatimonadota bacterium]
MTNATTVPTWLPGAFHDSLPKGAAADIARGRMADGDVNTVRYQTLYSEYLADCGELRALGARRSREHIAQITATGYGQFRR